MKRKVSVTAVLCAAFLLSGLSLASYAVDVGAQAGTDPILVGAGDIARCAATGDEATAALLDDIDGTVFTLGDNAYPNGTAAEFANCYGNSWGRHASRTKPSPGNHEYNTPGATGYFGYFGADAGDPEQGYYSYDLGGWHVVSLNSNCEEIAGGCAEGSPQQRWLEGDLAAHQSVCTLAYFHHPRFSSGSHGNNPAVASLWGELYGAGADVVLNGHDHVYERFARQNPSAQADPEFGMRQFTVGTGGAAFTAFKNVQPNSQVRIANTNGVLKMVLRPEGYDWEFVTAPAAATADSGSAACSTSSPPSSSDTAAPTVQAPEQALPRNSTLGESKVPTKISWSATDDESGVAGYELQQSVNGGAFKSVALGSGTSTSKTIQLSPGGTYQFRVRATDGASNTSAWNTGPSFLVDPQQEGSSAIDYAGNWTQEAASSAYGGGLRHATARGSVAQLTFAGRNVSYVAPKGPNKGKATISVDGAPVKTVDLYAPTAQQRKVVFSVSGLDPAGNHTIAVQVLGTKRSASGGTLVDVDAFVVLR